MQIFGSLKVKVMAGDNVCLFVSEVHHWKTVKSQHITVKSQHITPRTKIEDDKNKVKVK